MRSGRIVYHNNGRKDDRVTPLDEYSINSNLLTGLQLAKYVLMRLVDNQVSKKFQKTLKMMSGLSTVSLIFSQILDGLTKILLVAYIK